MAVGVQQQRNPPYPELRATIRYGRYGGRGCVGVVKCTAVIKLGTLTFLGGISAENVTLLHLLATNSSKGPHLLQQSIKCKSITYNLYGQRKHGVVGLLSQNTKGDTGTPHTSPPRPLGQPEAPRAKEGSRGQAQTAPLVSSWPSSQLTNPNCLQIKSDVTPMN
jgi:hypothetical protein